VTPEEIIRAFRAALLQRDDDALSELAASYQQLAAILDADIEALMNQIIQAQENGQEIKVSWVYKQARYEALINQVQQLIQSYGDQAQRITEGLQRSAVAYAGTNAFELLAAMEPTLAASFAALPTGAIESVVGFLSDGSPLQAYFAKFGEQAAQALETELVTGIGLGKGPREIARLMSKAVEAVSYDSALTTARNEHIRAYNSATLETYRANSAIVQRWQWIATLSPRTCMFCLGQHGREHELEEPFVTHVRCRCTVLPITRTLTLIAPGAADEWFGGLTEAQQESITGTKIAAEKLRSGELKLSDYVGFGRDDDWGPYGFERSTKQAMAAKQ
jgi:SPP1 gp7 family putative phage head morphogenesis protein